MIKIFTLCLTTLWLFSCGDLNYGPGKDNSCTPTKEYAGGITCRSGTNRDRNFLDFLSDRSNDEGIGNINCQPSESGGVLFNMKVTLNAPFDLNGNNNNLIMQPGSSLLKIGIYDTQAFSNTSKPIIIEFQGSNGQVNGNKATLSFIYNKPGILKTINVEGTFDANNFYGTMSFKNSVHLSGGTPASGSFGSFSIPTCVVFTYN